MLICVYCTFMSSFDPTTCMFRLTEDVKLPLGVNESECDGLATFPGCVPLPFAFPLFALDTFAPEDLCYNIGSG